MNFFEHQDDARRKSARLVLLLIAAVITLIVITSAFLMIFLYLMEDHLSGIFYWSGDTYTFKEHVSQALRSPLIYGVAGVVVTVVVCGSLFKSAQLRQGGDYVAQALGGRLLVRDNAESEQQVLLNVVEEMAIASGMQVPRVYLIDEAGINAFAAGTSPANAVIGVTNGCVQALTREQLQGVIAHEFSHIHHGDMRLNMRLIAMLHGILVIGLIGEVMFHSGTASRFRSAFRRNSRSSAGLAIGLALMAIGFGGVFFWSPN